MVASHFLAPRLAPAAPAPSPTVWPGVVPALAMIPIDFVGFLPTPAPTLLPGVIPNEIRSVDGKIWVRHWADNIWVHYGSTWGFGSEWVA